MEQALHPSVLPLRHHLPPLWAKGLRRSPLQAPAPFLLVFTWLRQPLLRRRARVPPCHGTFPSKLLQARPPATSSLPPGRPNFPPPSFPLQPRCKRRPPRRRRRRISP